MNAIDVGRDAVENLARPTDLTLQAVLDDNGAASSLRRSVSNAVFLRIR
ncbi:MAG: hypothetical protein HYR85_12820 [Planctomycetes bacterium]|nr:hypothetical protein [Planctomycetota bacterium]MBI3845647.1 hypothetical protein [Planctomycetota bacterium]